MSATITETRTTVLSAPKETSASYIPRGPITASLRFYRDPDDGAKPYYFVEKQPEGQPQANYGETVVDVTINDIRGRESDFSLDKDAFQAVQNVPSELTYDDWADDEVVRNKYYPEVEKFLLDNVPGAHKVTFFDHTTRRSTPDAARGPVQSVHIDQTTRAAGWRVKLHDPDEAEELLKGRYRIINVWRPLNGPIQAHPLAFASAGSVEDKDVIPVELRYPIEMVRRPESNITRTRSSSTGQARTMTSDCFSSVPTAKMALGEDYRTLRLFTKELRLAQEVERASK